MTTPTDIRLAIAERAHQLAADHNEHLTDAMNRFDKAYQDEVAAHLETLDLLAEIGRADAERDPCNGSCDIALAGRQVGPDGIVPGNARECAELWEREAARLGVVLAAERRNYLTVVDAIAPTTNGADHAAGIARETRTKLADAEARLAALTAPVPVSDRQLYDADSEGSSEGRYIDGLRALASLAPAVLPGARVLTEDALRAAMADVAGWLDTDRRCGYSGNKGCLCSECEHGLREAWSTLASLGQVTLHAPTCEATPTPLPRYVVCRREQVPDGARCEAFRYAADADGDARVANEDGEDMAIGIYMSLSVAERDDADNLRDYPHAVVDTASLTPEQLTAFAASLAGAK